MGRNECPLTTPNQTYNRFRRFTKSGLSANPAFEIKSDILLERPCATPVWLAINSGRFGELLNTLTGNIDYIDIALGVT